MINDPNIRTAAKLSLVACAMFGFGYVLVPIYEVFCEVTGFAGKTGEITQQQAQQSKIDTSRLVTVEFDTNVNGALPWRFKPTVRRIKIRPGELGETTFYAENTSNQRIIGQAVPSVTPALASIYFNKTECFCFTQQTLAPGEYRVMPVKFIVDSDLPENITTMTLSYTFFDTTESVSEQTNLATPIKKS